MSILKCKMCGGNLNIADHDTVCTCEYCGTTQTIPIIDSDKKARLFNRANDYRLSNDFSKAYNAYEAIVSENPGEAEAYWGMILSEYGVEYVDDPKTGKKIPTCHRTSLKSIKTNNNYLKAIEYADIEGKMIYEDEADQLDRLQKDILSVSSREKSYDVFICYKESDDNGERTIDSVIAQELYDELTNRGLNVFFARISLEDKFGQNYEPYIYNALRSAKVMLLVTTSNEHCNAPWVKNEWSRYLDFIKNDVSRSLIPVIKDMSPYELPDELQKLQVLDLNKIGAKQDLIRGVIKITGKETVSHTVSNNIANTDSLLKRANMFLEDGDFKSADEYFDRILDNDPENGDAYLGKLLCEFNADSIDSLLSVETSIENSINYKKAIRYLSDKSVYIDSSETLKNIADRIKNENANKEYKSLLQLIDSAKTISDYSNIIIIAEKISWYSNTNELIDECNKKINIIKVNQDRNKQRFVQYFIIVLISIALFASGLYVYQFYVKPSKEYDNIMTLLNNGQFDEALSLIENSKYDKSKNLINEYNYLYAKKLFDEQNYKDAKDAFTDLGDYKDSIALAATCETEIENLRINRYKSIKQADVGDSVFFGSFEQDNNFNNGKEDIEWLVINKDDNILMLISKKTLIVKSYSKSTEHYYDCTWANATIRSWLNTEFYNDSFTQEEKDFILLNRITTPNNKIYNTNGGSDTNDYLFLLSADEAEKYVSTESRVSSPTKYAESLGVHSGWLLRTPGSYQHFVAYYSTDKGYIDYKGLYIQTNSPIRMSLYIDIDKLPY